MKILILVSSYQLELCDFSFKYRSGADVRIVLLDHAERLAKIPARVRKHIEHIYECEKSEPTSSLSGLSHSSAFEKIAAEMSRYPGEYHVHTFFEFDTYLVSQLRQAFGLEGAKPDVILPFRDKRAMKQAVLRAGLRAPRFEILDVERLGSDVEGYFSDLIQAYALPFVCKPIDAAASIGVQIIKSLEDFGQIRHHIQQFHYVFELEEFIHGTLYHCDFLLRAHEVVFSGCGEYFFPNAEATRGKLIGSLILPQSHPDTPILTAFGERCLRALGLRDGAAHMEIFKTASGELVFLEVGARPPGLDVCSAYEEATGVNLISLAMKIEMGLDFDPPKIADGSAIWGQIPVRLGEVSDIARPATREDLKLTMTVQKGDVLESSFSYLQTMGKFSAHGESFGDLHRDFNHLKHFPFVTLKADSIYRRQISVIGAGLVGASCVVQLVDRIIEEGIDNIEINIFERSHRFGPGFAFGSTSDTSLTNTPAGFLSIYSDDYGHFLRWTRANQTRLSVEFDALFPLEESSHVPRRLFGTYLEEHLASARARAERAGVVLRFVRSEVVDICIDENDSVIKTAEGERYHSTDVIFALGNQPTQTFPHLEEHQGYFSSPYPEHRLRSDIDRNARVLVLGSRLTAVDAVLALAASGHRKKITVASREGVFPEVRGYMERNDSPFLNPRSLLDRIQNEGQLPTQAYLQALRVALEDVYGKPIPDEFFELPVRDGASQLQHALEQVVKSQAHWQKLTVSMIECMEVIWPFQNDQDKRSFLANEYKILLRYIAGLPVPNAHKILGLFSCRLLEIRPDLQSVEYDGRSGCFLATCAHGAPEAFDAVVNATGTGQSLLKSKLPLVSNLNNRGVFEFNSTEHFSVHRETLRVKTKAPVRTRFYAPATCCRGEFAITNFIDICIKHAKIVVDDIMQRVSERREWI